MNKLILQSKNSEYSFKSDLYKFVYNLFPEIDNIVEGYNNYCNNLMKQKERPVEEMKKLDAKIIIDYNKLNSLVEEYYSSLGFQGKALKLIVRFSMEVIIKELELVKTYYNISLLPCSEKTISDKIKMFMIKNDIIITLEKFLVRIVEDISNCNVKEVSKYINQLLQFFDKTYSKLNDEREFNLRYKKHLRLNELLKEQYIEFNELILNDYKKEKTKK